MDFVVNFPVVSFKKFLFRDQFNLEFMLGEVKVVEVAIKHKSFSLPCAQTEESRWRSTICMKVKV